MYQDSETMRQMATAILIDETKQDMVELYSRMTEHNVKLGFLITDKEKRHNGKVVFADCEKLNEKHKALAGYDFVITFYNDTTLLDREKLEILMYHELKHVGIDEKGRRSIKPHDVEDFACIIEKYGVDWVD